MKAIFKISLAALLCLGLSSCATMAVEVAKVAGAAAVKGIFDAMLLPDEDEDDDYEGLGIFSPSGFGSWQPSQSIYSRN